MAGSRCSTDNLRIRLPHLVSVLALFMVGGGGAIHSVVPAAPGPHSTCSASPVERYPFYSEDSRKSLEFFGIGSMIITRWWGKSTPSHSLGLEKGVLLEGKPGCRLQYYPAQASIPVMALTRSVPGVAFPVQSWPRDRFGNEPCTVRLYFTS